ncbi:MAG: efflux RND transporter periplasmic adaptor subunit [Alteromonadaceae bacterium]|nr:efflux RND transporter periplasmic adaptor subunit [Alteromonadaceae bacterium]
MKNLNYLIVLSSLFLLGCNNEKETPLLYTVATEKFEVIIPAKGELYAAKATIVSAPITSHGVQIIAWLAPEFSSVKKGDIIARFDGELMTVQSRNKQKELAITEQNIVEKSGKLIKDIGAIQKDITVVGYEKDFAEKFSIDDANIRSKLKIIDSLQNTEYLGTKQQYLNWKSDSFSESSQGDMGLLEMQKQQHESKLNQLRSSLSQLEVKAPHDGLLVYKTNWRGEKPREGQSLWSGQKMAELPDTSVMKAKLFVFENEALDLEKGKPVNFSLNAYGTQIFKGEIESVAPFPKSIKRGDPQKYFEVIVTLTKQNSKLFVPGSKIEANIIISQESSKIIIPLQSVFSKQNQSYVYVYNKGEFTITAVDLGQTSLSHVEIISGLAQGQQIALTDREKS